MDALIQMTNPVLTRVQHPGGAYRDSPKADMLKLAVGVGEDPGSDAGSDFGSGFGSDPVTDVLKTRQRWAIRCP